MLKIKPSCEHCDRDLPNGDKQARICSYECTFCADCVENVLEGVCPNCGGGFVERPIRPLVEWRAGVSVQHQMPSSERVLKPVDTAEHKVFVSKVKATS